VAGPRAKQELAQLVAKAGFDVDGFEKFRMQHQPELRRLAEKLKADAGKQSSAATEVLRRDIAERRKRAEYFPALPAPPSFVSLDRPFLIWPTQGISFDSSHYEPYNSSAKLSYQSDAANGYEELSFYFLWENPSDRVAVIDAHGYLVLKGIGQAGQSGGLFSWGSMGDLYLSVQIVPLQWWNQPPTPAPAGSDAHQQALTLLVQGGGWNDVGEIDSVNIFRGYDLLASSLLIPAHGVMVFEVMLNIQFQNDNGWIGVDFTFSDFEVLCPEVLIAIQT
jgi:hypothetical protein